jgi:hypothetical protein
MPAGGYGADRPAGFNDQGTVTSSGCFSPVAAGVTAHATSQGYEKDMGATQTAVESLAALYRSQAASAVVFEKLYFSKKAPTCAYARFKKNLGKNDKVANMRLIPIRSAIDTLQLAVWNISLELREGKKTMPVELVITGYLRGRALSQRLVGAFGVNPVHRRRGEGRVSSGDAEAEARSRLSSAREKSARRRNAARARCERSAGAPATRARSGRCA